MPRQEISLFQFVIKTNWYEMQWKTYIKNDLTLKQNIYSLLKSAGRVEEF